MLMMSSVQLEIMIELGLQIYLIVDYFVKGMGTYEFYGGFSWSHNEFLWFYLGHLLLMVLLNTIVLMGSSYVFFLHLYLIRKGMTTF